MGHFVTAFGLLLALMISGCTSIQDFQLSAGHEESAEPEEPGAAPASDRITSASGAISQEAVIDGDSILLGGKSIRLYGIDAPEQAQSCYVGDAESPCGRIARHALIGFVAGVTVRCDPVDVDRRDRYVGRCWAGNFDLSAAMVGAGLALPFPGNEGHYAGERDLAKAQRRGIWKGLFVQPWVWRARRGE